MGDRLDRRDFKSAVGRGQLTPPKKPYHIAYSKFVMYVPLLAGGGVPDTPDGHKIYLTYWMISCSISFITR